MLQTRTAVNGLCVIAVLTTLSSASAEDRPRARDIGLVVGTFPTGELNAITDVGGVKVGHSTIVEGDDIRTGVTAIIPGPGNLYTHPIPAWIHVGNGYGKLIGETQVREFGEIETPILLTCTLCVWSAANALKDWTYEQPGMGEHTVNPIVGETNDSRVNNMWADPVQHEHVYAALADASGGAVEEGSVGAGTGTQAFAWKGGIGTSSRVLPDSLGGYTVGVLVQTNYGGTLTMNGAPVGREFGQYSYRRQLEALGEDDHQEDGSIMMVLATDAPINTPELVNESMSPLFAAAAEATEEAIYNAILKATTVTSSRGTLEAISVDDLLKVLNKYGVLNQDKTISP